MPKYYRTTVERNIDSSKDENTLKISTDDPTVTKMTLNGKEIGSGTHTRKLSDGSTVSTNPTAAVREGNAVKNNNAKSFNAVAKEEKAAKADNKNVVVEKEEDKRTFWQRHPVLRVLLIVFLCLLLVGLLMISVYHIVHAINNAKKNDKIDEAKKADEEVKKNKDKLSKENKEKFEKGELKSDKLKEDLKKEQTEADNAKESKEQFDNYKNSSDADKSKYADAYADSQKKALENGELKSEDLKTISDKENNDLKVANEAKDASYANLTKDDKNGLTTYQAEQLKNDKDITVLNNEKASGATKTDVTLYNDYKAALTAMKNAKQTTTGNTNKSLISEKTFNDILEGRIKVTNTGTADTPKYSYTDDKGVEIKTDPFSSIKDATDKASANKLAADFTKVADNDNTIVNHATNLTDTQKAAIHSGTFDVKTDNKFVPSDKQQGLIDDYKSKAATSAQEQIEADYAQKRYEDVLAYEGASESEKAAKLTAFGDNEKKAMENNIKELSKYYDDKYTAENKDVTEMKELLSNVESIEENQAKLQQIAKDNDFEYTNTTTTDEMTAAIENNYDNKFPKSDGWFRKAGDAAAAVGVAGLAGTGIASLIANNEDKKKKTSVKHKKTVVKQNVDNGNADNNVQTARATNTITK